jgi:SNF2 family DNA or RNA helicase
MGLGKTVQTIAFLLHKVAEGASLVVAPVSVVPNWKRELERFAPSLNVVVLNSADDRAAAIKEAAAGAVVLSSYGMLLSGDAIVEKEWNVVVLDEAHAIKNRDTKTSAVTMKLNCKSRMILTGTPIQNNLGELWNLFQFVNPGLLGGWEVFKRKYMQPIEEEKDKERQKQLKRLVQPFMLRRTKADVLDDLPEKNEIILPVELTDEELSVYEFIRRRAENMLKEGGNKIEVQTLAEITRLRQAACCASLVKKGWTGSCAKIDLLMSTLENITTGGNRTLLFSQFTSFLDIVKKRLDEAGIEYLYLDGGTTIKQREKLVQRFQQGETSLFIISLKAGGLGLNLTGANYVVHLDPWWNPAIEQQATDRAYRIGQQQNVTVYHLVSKNTIEEKILRLHQSKRNMADALLEGSDVSNKLTAAQLLDMIGD